MVFKNSMRQILSVKSAVLNFHDAPLWIPVPNPDTHFLQKQGLLSCTSSAILVEEARTRRKEMQVCL
jgi:hypothetical protein